jgi:hypothetical protein
VAARRDASVVAIKKMNSEPYTAQFSKFFFIPSVPEMTSDIESRQQQQGKSTAKRAKS